MAYRPHPKGASTNSRSPRAWATCDRTGFVLNHFKLGWQSEWAGNSLINTGSLVRSKSRDKPQQQFRSLNLPPDPKPVFNARVENYTIDEAGPQQTSIAIAAAKGATTINVASVTGFSMSQPIYVYLDGGGFSFQTITSIGASSFGISTPLQDSAAVNNIVIATGANDVNE